MNRLLEKQLAASGLDKETPPETPAQWRNLLRRLDNLVEQQEQSQYLLERSLTISTEEMWDRQDELERRSQSAIHQERERLRTVVDSLEDGLCAYSFSHGFLFANIACSLYFEPRELPDDIDELFDCLYRDAVGDEPAPIDREELITELAIGGAKTDFRAYFEATEGTRIPISCSFTPLSESGSLVGFVLLFRNLTTQLEVESNLRSAMEKAMEADRAKTDFLAVVSHEIRTPINVILGSTELLSDTELSDRQQKLSRLIIDSGHHLLQLVDDILAVISRNPPVGRLQLETYDLRALVASIVDMMKKNAEAKQLTLMTRVSDEVPSLVRGKPRYLRQILINLIGNAVKFTDKGQITVELSCAGRHGWIRCTVSDTGVGIAPEMIESVFSPFVQADSTLTRPYAGLGLGLSIVKKLVQELGGEVWVESRPDRGSRFSFTLPCEPLTDHADTAPPASKAPPPDIQLSGKRILLVEDCAEMTMLFTAFLEAAQVTVLNARDGAEAVQLFKQHRPDAVLMDAQMPIMDGYEATRRIRAWEAAGGHRPTPIIALTAHAAAEHVRMSKKAGCNAHVSKPVSRTRLHQTLVRCMMAARSAEDGLPPFIQITDSV